MIASTKEVNELWALGTIAGMGVAGYGTVGIRLSGSFTGTVTFEGSVDGSTFIALTVSTFGGTTATTASGGGQWLASCAGLTVVRCRMSAYTSGTVAVFIQAVPHDRPGGGGGGGGAGNPSLPDTSVQFNNAGSFGGDAGFTWNGSSIVLSSLAATSTMSNFILSSDTGLFTAPSYAFYDPASAIFGGGTLNAPRVTFTVRQGISYHSSQLTGSAPGLVILQTVDPGGNQNTTAGGGAIKLRGYIPSSNTHIVSGTLGIDSYCTNEGTGQILQVIQAISAWAENKGAAVVSGATIGGYFIANQTHASGVSPVYGVVIDPTNGATMSPAGTISAFHGLYVFGMDAGSATITDRAAIRIDAMSGSATNDFSILSKALQPCQFYSNLYLGNSASSTGGLYLFRASTAFYTAIQASGANAASWTMTLPTNVPAVNGYVLSATTAGVCSWVAGGGGGISGLTSDRIVFGDTATSVKDIAGILYNATYTGPAGTDPAHPSLVTTTAITANSTFTQTALGQQGIYSNVTYTPSGPAISGNMRGVFASVHATGANAAYIISAVDAYASVDDGQGYLTVIGVTSVAATQGASTGTGAILGMVASGVQQHASGVVPLCISMSIDPTNGGSRTLRGTVTTLYGARITGMTTASMAAPPTTRAGLYIDVMASTATSDYAILSDATQPVKLASTSLLLASGAILNWNAGLATLTQNPLNLTLGGSAASMSLLVTNGALQAASHVGGSGTTSTVTIYPTFGVGTTGADIIFKGGNNGASEWGRFLHGGTLVLGVAGTLSGTMAFAGGTSGSVALRAQAVAGSWTMQLPAAAPGVNGYVLSATTAGVCSWISPTAATGTQAYVTTAVSYAILTTDYFVKVTVSGTTMTLPTAVSAAGKIYVVDNAAASGTITVDTTSSQTMNGSLTLTIAANNALAVYSDGANWRLF